MYGVNDLIAACFVGAFFVEGPIASAMDMAIYTLLN